MILVRTLCDQYSTNVETYMARLLEDEWESCDAYAHVLVVYKCRHPYI